MAFPDRRALNVLMTTLLFAVVLAIVYVARAVIVIFAFSILFAYLINRPNCPTRRNRAWLASDSLGNWVQMEKS